MQGSDTEPQIPIHRSHKNSREGLSHLLCIIESHCAWNVGQGHYMPRVTKCVQRVCPGQLLYAWFDTAAITAAVKHLCYGHWSLKCWSRSYCISYSACLKRIMLGTATMQGLTLKAITAAEKHTSSHRFISRSPKSVQCRSKPPGHSAYSRV